jgi:hypothetical protein
MIAKVKIISPILIDGVWLKDGEHHIDLDVAIQEESKGNIDIISIDDKEVVWGSCCSNH